MRNLPQRASPLNDHPVNITRTEEIRDPLMLRGRVLMHTRHH